MPENIASQQQSAKHLAARAIIAYRPGFPVSLLSVTSSSEHSSGIVCDWKGQRDSLHNDVKLLARAFAFVYVGSIVDQAISEPISDELRKELVSDMSSALDARTTCGRLGGSQSSDRHQSLCAYRVQVRLAALRIDQPLIESLAREFTSQGTIEGDALRKCSDANASPLNFDELETSTTCGQTTSTGVR